MSPFLSAASAAATVSSCHFFRSLKTASLVAVRVVSLAPVVSGTELTNGKEFYL
jgi:hypothetical protein